MLPGRTGSLIRAGHIHAVEKWVSSVNRQISTGARRRYVVAFGIEDKALLAAPKPLLASRSSRGWSGSVIQRGTFDRARQDVGAVSRYRR